jgi:hypothetical protein
VLQNDHGLGSVDLLVQQPDPVTPRAGAPPYLAGQSAAADPVLLADEQQVAGGHGSEIGHDQEVVVAGKDSAGQIRHLVEPEAQRRAQNTVAHEKPRSPVSTPPAERTVSLAIYRAALL